MFPRPARIFLVAAATALTMFPARAHGYCAAKLVQDNDGQRLKDAVVAQLKDRLAGNLVSQINKWSQSSNQMLKLVEDETLRAQNNRWDNGLALHITLCANSTRCDEARRNFSNSPDYDSETSLANAYKKLLQNKTFRAGEFAPNSWGSWFAVSFDRDLAISVVTSGRRSRTENRPVATNLHMSLIHVYQGGKRSDVGMAVAEAIRAALGEGSYQLKFQEVVCN